MPNTVTNTAIVNESWNARGLITHNAVTKALVRADDGTLWAAVREGHVKEYINIYRSQTGGFTWEPMYTGDFLEVTRRTGIAGLNQNGPFMHLTLSEERGRLILWHMFYETVQDRFDLEPFIFEIGEGGLTRLTEVADHARDGITLNADQLALDVSYTSTHIYLTYASLSSIHVDVYDHTYQTSVDGTGSTGTILGGDTYFNVLATHANDNNTLDIVAIKDDSPTYTLQYMRWDRLAQTFSTPVAIQNFPVANIYDLNVERDGNGHLVALWTQENAAGTAITIKYALSTDNGGTWTVTEVPFTPGQTSFTDAPTNKLTGRTVLLGGLQGFLLGYVRLLDGSPRGYLRTLLYNNTDYDLGPEGIVYDGPITGYRFFRPTGTELLDLDQIGEVRIAYQVGAASSTVQVDRSPVVFGQHLLREAADFSLTSSNLDEDTPGDGQIAVYFNILGAPSENLDYYAEGLIGTTTSKYMAAFEKIGTVTDIYRYEPTPEAETSDRSAYGDPIRMDAVRALVQPTSYAFPMSSGTDSFTTMVERDQRKVHLPPNAHLSRTFLVNAGNHLKRTVWLLLYDGNEYEISQVVPRFFKDEIAFYEANAYVVGPSNDPFSRPILPSET